MTAKPLRFSAPDWCFATPEVDPAEYYEALKQSGYDAVEMVPRPRRAEARRAGLEILNFGAPGMQEGINERRHHAALLPAIRQTIRESAEDGIPQVIVFSGNRGPGVTDGPVACREALEQLLPDAAAVGVVLVFEMLCKQNHPGYEADYSAYGFDLAAHFQSPYLRVLLDLYHMGRMGEDPAALIRNHAADIAHLHVAGSPKRDFPGPDQEIDFGACVRAAAEVGYDGYWGMEFMTAGNRLDAARAAVERFRTYDGSHK